MIIKWCLRLKLLSSACYDSLRSTNVLVLPSQRTLRDYTHFVKASSGFSVDVDKQLQGEAKIDTIPDYQKHVCLIFDEVKIKEDLVFNKHTGELIGFTNIGELNECLFKFEQACRGEIEQPQLATHMLVFMVSGLLSDLQFPYVQFPTDSITADQLYSLVWECVRHLEAIEFKVLAITCDGASPNRKFFRLHDKPSELVYKTANVYSADSRPLFFLSDVPHLIKTVRNCWANSFGHSHSRTLWVRYCTKHTFSVACSYVYCIMYKFTALFSQINGQFISWQHIVDLYHKHKGNRSLTSGLSILTKIKWEHVHLTSYSKMRVDLAAQVYIKRPCKLD